jgi:hypothetical protein
LISNEGDILKKKNPKSLLSSMANSGTKENTVKK